MRTATIANKCFQFFEDRLVSDTSFFLEAFKQTGQRQAKFIYAFEIPLYTVSILMNLVRWHSLLNTKKSILVLNNADTLKNILVSVGIFELYDCRIIVVTVWQICQKISKHKNNFDLSFKSHGLEEIWRAINLLKVSVIGPGINVRLKLVLYIKAIWGNCVQTGHRSLFPFVSQFKVIFTDKL